MSIEVAMNTPLADAINREIQPKLVECGWAPSDASDTTMAEYILLMIVNGKTEGEIASELSSDLLNLPPEDSSARDFSRWLFQVIETENAKINGPAQASSEALHSIGDQDMDMDFSASDTFGDISAPTGPKAMRNGAGGFRGGRDKRMLGQINRAMDRADSVLHRIRGPGGATDRINTHARGAPAGPRNNNGAGFGAGRQQQRNMNSRTAANFNHAMTAAAQGGGMPWMGQPGQQMQPGMPPGPMDVYAMLEQQSRMMQQMQEQMQNQMMQANRRGGFNQNPNRGRPLSERVQYPNQNHKNFRNGHHNSHNNHQQSAENGDAKKNGAENGGIAAEGGDIDMGGEGEQSQQQRDPSETMCKYNLRCTNKDCKFAHQSPAAPPGVTVDVSDVCTFGAACKNKKCVARHPSPATRAAHQSEQDCKFYPNCANPNCPFRHPNMPLCRNGGDCSVPGCKFTHVQTMCKYHPCTNRYCTFKHEDGQRGTFPDKVWTADGSHKEQTHISERKFVDESVPEETILPGADDNDMAAAEASIL